MSSQPKRHMITHSWAEGRFGLGVVAIVKRGDDVLLHQAVEDNFWVLPGGRAEPVALATASTARRNRASGGCFVCSVASLSCTSRIQKPESLACRVALLTHPVTSDTKWRCRPAIV